MYYCRNCKIEFATAEQIFEKHGLKSGPYEKLFVCPACKSTEFYEIKTSHCKCCGIKLSGNSKYCSERCKKRGELLWRQQLSKEQALLCSPIYAKVREINSYNKLNGTDYSYGKYISLFGK